MAEKPALEDDSDAEKVAQKAILGDISPADLPRNERQIRPLIEKLEHNGERLKVWADVVATGEKPTQRLVEAKIAELSVSAFALRLGKSKGYVTQVVHAATVFQKVFTQVNGFDPTDRAKHLTEIHAAPLNRN